jgi:hypothetical protein
MSNKKLTFTIEKKAVHNYNSKKLIFKKFNDSLITTPKRTFSTMKHALKPSKLTQKQPQNRISLDIGANHGLHTRPGIGLYPVPTGRILRTYATEHHLLPKDKKILNELPLSLQGLIKIKRPTHEEKEKMSYDQIVANSSKRYMDPFSDSDGDGVVNMADCRPLNKKKQDFEMDQYDIKGNTLPDKDTYIKNKKEDPHEHLISKIKPVKSVEVKSKHKQIEVIED